MAGFPPSLGVKRVVITGGSADLRLEWGPDLVKGLLGNGEQTDPPLANIINSSTPIGLPTVAEQTLIPPIHALPVLYSTSSLDFSLPSVRFTFAARRARRLRSGGCDRYLKAPCSPVRGS